MKTLFKATKLLAIFVLMISMAAISGCTNTDDDIPNEDAVVSYMTGIDWDFYNERAAEFITLTARGDFNMAAAMFNETILQEFGVNGLQAAWEEIISLAGEFIEVHETVNVEADGYFISGVIMRHENFGFGWNFVFSEDGIITGLSSGGTIPLSGLTANNERTATVIQRDGFTDYNVIVGEKTNFPLNGILSMPNNTTGQVPAVVLVHGTGASDMNGVPAAIPHSPNQPFRDIAEYLAANGIAVLRYDKRTHTHGGRIYEEYGGSFTVMQETVEDAVLAANILRSDPRIDENRVFIIGHSMGGMLAPRIHAEGGDFAGLIFFAGSPRFLLDISVTQNIMMIEAMLENVEDDEEREALLALIQDIPIQMRAQIDGMLQLSDEEARDIFVPELGVSVYYILDMYRNPAPLFLEKATVPILVMQPEKDMQVLADVDFALYKELLTGRGNVTFKLFEGLNHIFMTTTAENITDTLLDWEIPNNVDTQVLASIVEWIKGQ